ncbi:MAG: hypothetical protein P8M79_01935 [Alphaproteobacteria bacterium]|nr:hypothetical protein [Alphaproteobacteria bacterium]
MPSLTLHVDKTLANERLTPETVRGLGHDLETAVLYHLKPASKTFQFDLIVCETCGPTYPVSMSLHFRATEARGEPVVMACLQEIAAAIADHLGAGARLRAFAIDQSGLFSLDHKTS